VLHFALVGCGRIAQRHAQLLGHKQIAGAKLAAVCDLQAERARKFGEDFDVPYFSDLHAMMEDAPIDVVSVLTPGGLHAENIVALAPYRKHIVVEKPMALTLDDADLMIEACASNGVKLFVVKQNRFNVPIVKLREAVDAQRFGRLFLGTVRVRWCRTQDYYDQDPWRGTWALDGGVLSNQASHHLDLLEWIMGDVESVFAKGITALARVETEDTAIATLKFKNGALGLVEATTATRPKDLEGSISILGEFGSVEIGGFAANELKTWNFVDNDPDDSRVFTDHASNPNVSGYAHKAYYDHVVDCITNERRILVDGVEGRRSLELITAIYESIETGREIHLPFKPDRCRLGRKAPVVHRGVPDTIGKPIWP
jgi:predicted dehydrogenase